MKYVSEVTSNLKNHAKPTKLYPKTLILARNKAGKSAIVNALEVALTGTVSDVVGRPLVKEVNRLLALSREDARLWAKVSVSNGEADNMEERADVEWATKGKKGSFIAQPAGVYNPATVFPLRMVREALAGAADSTRKFFIRFVAGGITDEDVLAQIPTPLHDAFQAVTTAIPRTAPVDLLLAGLANAKERLQVIRAEVRTRKDVVQEAGQGLAPMPSEKDYADVQAQIAEVEVQIAEMDRDRGRAQASAQAQATYVNLRARKEEIEQILEDYRTRLNEANANAPTPPNPADLVRPKLLDVLRFAHERQLDACPACRKARPDSWEALAAAVEAKVTERAAVNEEHRVHQQLVEELHEAIELQSEQHMDVCTRLEALGEMPDAHDDGNFAVAYGELKSDLDLLRQQLRSMDAAKASWAPVLKARDAAAEKEAEIDRWTRLIDALKIAIGNLLDKGRDEFVARVQRFLPPDDIFGLELRDDDREICRYGLVRSGKVHEGLSGVEWAYVTAAIAAAAIPDNEQDKLHVVVFEDRAWDADTLLAVCQATTALDDAQVIIATTPPDGWGGKKFPHEWHIIDPTDEVHPKARDEIDEFQKEAEGGKDEIEAQREENAKAPEGEAPKFIREYLAKNPNATAADLVREFKISPNRAQQFAPQGPPYAPKRRGRPRKVKEEGAPPPARDLAPELE